MKNLLRRFNSISSTDDYTECVEDFRVLCKNVGIDIECPVFPLNVTADLRGRIEREDRDPSVYEMEVFFIASYAVNAYFLFCEI